MSASLTRYFGVRRDSVSNPVKKVQISDKVWEAKSKVIVESQPTPNAKRTIRSRNKTNADEVLHKIKGKPAVCIDLIS